MRRLLFTVILAVSIVAAPDRVDAGGSCPQYEKLLARYLPAKTVKTFSRIAWRESRCNPKSISAVRRSTGYPDIGLLQVQGSWRTVTYAVCGLRPNQSHVKALTRLDCHLRVARYLYDNGGLGHWRATSGQ
jgi:hypothetical protein